MGGPVSTAPGRFNFCGAARGRAGPGENEIRMRPDMQSKENLSHAPSFLSPVLDAQGLHPIRRAGPRLVAVISTTAGGLRHAPRPVGGSGSGAPHSPSHASGVPHGTNDTEVCQ